MRNFIHVRTMRDKEGGDGFVDPRVADLVGPTHWSKGPPSLGLVHVVISYYIHVGNIC